MAEIPLLLYGATGRMGRAVRECIPEFPELRLTACVAPRKPAAGAASGGSWLTPDELAKRARDLPSDLVVLDFSLAPGTARLAEILSEAPRALVAATTGLDAATESRLASLATRAPVLRAPNLSLGIAIAGAFLRALPPAAGDTFQAEIVEHHHAGKKDAPSGTAKALADLVKQAGAGQGAKAGERLGREVPIHSIRGGTVPGKHQVILSGAGETLEIVHTVFDRSVFARGALRAALFLHGRAPGRYTIEDVLREA